MTLDEKKAALTDRANRNLINTSVITSSVIDEAADEAESITSGKDVPLYAWLDVAMYRLKINLKIQIGETDTNLYNQAIKVVRQSPTTDSTYSQTETVVKNRDETLWL